MQTVQRLAPAQCEISSLDCQAAPRRTIASVPQRHPHRHPRYDSRGLLRGTAFVRPACHDRNAKDDPAWPKFCAADGPHAWSAEARNGGWSGDLAAFATSDNASYVVLKVPKTQGSGHFCSVQCTALALGRQLASLAGASARILPCRNRVAASCSTADPSSCGKLLNGRSKVSLEKASWQVSSDGLQMHRRDPPFPASACCYRWNPFQLGCWAC